MREPKQTPPTDLRQHRARTERDLILGGIAVVFLIGGTMIYLLWGVATMLATFACFVGVLALAFALWLLLRLLEWASKDRG